MTSAIEARRIAVAAQGLSGKRAAGRPSRARILAAVDRLGVLQIDSVNVLARAPLLGPSRVEGWDRPAWIHRDSLRRRWAPSAALVGPFDPIVWHRPRALRMFGFHYRIGIYTPVHARTHGYYVLPFLLGDALVARLDLKADRARGVLAVRGAWLEAGHPAEAVAGPLAVELLRMASFLELEGVEVARKGTLAAALRSSVRG